MDEATKVITEFVCARCGSASSFDGNASEWCPACRTDEFLVRHERIYADTGIEWRGAA